MPTTRSQRNTQTSCPRVSRPIPKSQSRKPGRARGKTQSSPEARHDLCFADSYWANRKGTLTNSQVLESAVAHFRGVRHPHAARAYGGSDGCQKILYEPFLSSIRTTAVGGGRYEPLTERQTTRLLGIFEQVTNKDVPEYKTIENLAGLMGVLKPPKPNIVQPIAVLAAREKRADILEHCLDSGAEIDRNLVRASTQGDTQGKGWDVHNCEYTDARMREVLAPYREELKMMTKGRKNSDGRWSSEQIEEWFGDIHW